MPSWRMPFWTILTTLMVWAWARKVFAQAAMLPLSSLLRPQMIVSNPGTLFWLSALLPRASFLRPARAVRASAMRMPARGPSPLLFKIRFLRGMWLWRKVTSGAWVFSPKALSDRSTV